MKKNQLNPRNKKKKQGWLVQINQIHVSLSFPFNFQKKKNQLNPRNQMKEKERVPGDGTNAWVMNWSEMEEILDGRRRCNFLVK